MSARDALKALECGASGVIVSNSGGRTLDGTVATVFFIQASLNFILPK